MSSTIIVAIIGGIIGGTLTACALEYKDLKRMADNFAEWDDLPEGKNR